jgi:hypothetical protein
MPILEGDTRHERFGPDVPSRGQSRQPRAPDQGSDAALGKNRDHFIWPSNLAAPLPLFDNRSSASRPPAA